MKRPGASTRFASRCAVGVAKRKNFRFFESAPVAIRLASRSQLLIFDDYRPFEPVSDGRWRACFVGLLPIHVYYHVLHRTTKPPSHRTKNLVDSRYCRCRRAGRMIERSGINWLPRSGRLPDAHRISSKLKNPSLREPIRTLSVDGPLATARSNSCPARISTEFRRILN